MMKHAYITGILLLILNIGSASAQESTEKQTPPGNTAPRTVVITRPADEKVMKYKMLPLKTMDYATVEATCKSWLSEGGIMTFESYRNSILVYDTEEVIKKISDFISEADRDTVNIRIEISFNTVETRSNSGFRVETNQPGKQQKTTVIKPEIRKGSSSSFNSQILVVSEGCPASLWAGTTTIDPQCLQEEKLCPEIYVITQNQVIRIPVNSPDIRMVNIGASLKVLPKYFDDGTVDLEFYPAFSYIEGKGPAKSVKIQSLSSHLRVKEGQRVYIGGLISAKQNNYLNIFGPDFFRDSSGRSATDMYLTVHVLKPGDTRAGKAVIKNRGSY